MKRFWQSRWRDSIVLVPLLIIAWQIYGYVLTDELFDNRFGRLAVLHSLDTIFAYLGVLFAVQIPVFILLLQKMHDSGYVRRLVLPSVISFREILVSYIVMSLLLLLSPRVAYYYFPVIALTTLSLYTLVEAVRVMFESRKLKSREDSYVERLVENALSASLKGRININNFFETIKDYPHVTHSLLDIGHDDKETDRHYMIRTNRAGIVESIDIKKLYELVMNEYYNDVPKITGGKAGDATPIEKPVRVVVLVRPRSIVKKQDEVIKLVVADGVKKPGRRFLNNLQDSIRVVLDHPDSVDRQLDDIIKDFKQQIRLAIDKNDTVAVGDALGVYEILVAGLATLHFDDENSGYDLETARKEFNQMFSDSVSDRLRNIAEIIEDEFDYAIRTEHQEVVKSLITSMYKSILHATSKFDVLTAARAERAFMRAIASLLYAEDTFTEDSAYKNTVLNMLTFRVKEHTSLLLYNYREYNSSMSFSKDQLVQWIEIRLGDIRGFMMNAYKKSNLKAFDELKSVFDTVEEDYDLYHEKVEGFALLTRCMLFVIAAYINGRDETDEQKAIKEILDKYFNNLTPHDLTRILVECIDRDYADKWRIDTYDLVADGKMHSVPDFGLKLKTLWVDYMLSFDDIPGDLQSYEGIPLARTGTFTDQSSDTTKAFIAEHLNSLQDTKHRQQIDNLKKLVGIFAAERIKWENETLSQAPLDDGMVKDFRDGVLKGYKDSALALSVFQPTSHLEFVSKAPSGFLSYGWNQIQDKYGFVKDWHIGVGHQTHEYGSQIARAENTHMLETLFSKVRNVQDFSAWIRRLRKEKNTQWFIVSVGVAEWYIRFHRPDIAKYMESDISKGQMQFKGVNQIIPVYYTYMDSIAKGLYAVEVSDIGRLKIKGAPNKLVRVSIDAYSHNEALLKAITKSPPAWLAEKGDLDEQIAFLKTQVRMLIQHPFRYERPSKSKVYFFRVTDEDSD